MASQAQISALAEKHRALEAAIEEEMTRPFADSLKIAELKREKLRIKEDLVHLEDEAAHA